MTTTNPETLKLDTGTASIRLTGISLVAARVVWVVLMLMGAMAAAASLPELFAQQITSVDPAQPADILHLTPDILLLLETLGISRTAFGVVSVGAFAILAAVSVASAVFIFTQRSDYPVALIVSLWAGLFGMLIFASNSGAVFVQPYVPPPVTVFITWLAWSLLHVAFLIFPDGRMVPRWGWVIIIYAAGFSALWSFIPLEAALHPTNWDPLVYLLTSAGQWLLPTSMVLYRYLRVASPMQRQQIKWVAYAAGVIMFVFTATLPPLTLLRLAGVGGMGFAVVELLAGLLVVLSLNLLPLALAFSVMQSRLWDVDFVINRSLVYGGVTLMVIAVLGGGFALTRALLQALLGSEMVGVAVALPAIVATALFNPVRRWLRHIVDERLYGIGINYTPGRQQPLPEIGASSLTTATGTYGGLSLIGRGGMGEVYRAQHPKRAETVAIKLMPPAIAADPDFTARFAREARTVGALSHPNIVQLIDYGVSDDTPYMVMEYIDGPGLDELLKGGGPLPLEQAHRVLSGVAAALDYAHGQGIVHRDVKPSNIMLATDERPVLMDFGIARMAEGTRLTGSGTLGTFQYISPEQIREARLVDARADIYSLGVV
ncbi:MAG: serine/threonine protein kinase, partial [Chloroflexi bacterium]|nr:serine/threonine protein kinase [Chloroflexota bacterium]